MSLDKISYYEVISGDSDEFVSNNKIAQISGTGEGFVNFITDLLNSGVAKVRLIELPYSPYKIKGNIALVPVFTKVCMVCKSDMLSLPAGFYETTGQLKHTNFEITSNSYVEGSLICKKCEGSGKASFVCYLCEISKPSSKLEYSVGDPCDNLCVDCYKTVVASEWDNTVNELDDIHRYDYE